MQVHVADPVPGEKRGWPHERPEDPAPAPAIDSFVSATLLRATRYAGLIQSNAKQGALRSAQREGGQSARSGFPDLPQI